MRNATPHARSALALFAAMALFLPWPFDYVAVLSLASIPLMIGTGLWGIGEAMSPPSFSSLLAIFVALPMLVFTLAQAALGLYVFCLLARRLASVLARTPQPRAALALALALIFAASWLPVFGGGENLAGGVRLHNLYAEYARAAGITDCSGMAALVGADPCAVTSVRPAPRAPAGRPLTLEGMGAPAIAIRPTRPVEITGPQLECMKAGGRAAECGLQVPSAAATIGSSVEAGTPSSGASAPIAGRPIRAITVEQGRCLRNGGTPQACLGRDRP